MRACYLIHILDTLGPARAVTDGGDDPDGKGTGKGTGKGKSKGKGNDKRDGRHKPTAREAAEERAMVAGGAVARGIVKEDRVSRAGTAIVFVSTIHSAQFVTELLSEMGILCTALHSAMSQKRRIASLQKFKSCVVPVCGVVHTEKPMETEGVYVAERGESCSGQSERGESCSGQSERGAS